MKEPSLATAAFGTELTPPPPESLISENTRAYDSLPPFLRLLLITDGTVTRTLKAYFGEPIDVKVLEHAEIASQESYPGLGVVVGDPVLKRLVTLKGRLSQTIYACASSIIVIGFISPEVRRHLTEEKKGIGELLRESKLETYRELLYMRRSQAGQWARCLDVDENSSVVARTYRLHCGRRAAIEIQEIFPESRFARPPSR